MPREPVRLSTMLLCSPLDGGPLKIDEWESGCLVRSSSLNGHDYEIDVETGIARNVSVMKRRPW